MKRLLAGLLPLLLVACASVPPQRPLDLHAEARALASRQLNTPGLMAAEHRFGLSDQASAAWTPDRLTVAAWYFDPRLAYARAAATRRAADATLAAQRTNPTLKLSPEKAFSGLTSGSPWTMGLSLLVPLLHPGETAARRDVAAADTQAAHDQSALAIWQSRTRALRALRGVLLTRRAEKLASAATLDWRAYLQGIRQRVQAGADARSNELMAQLDLQRAQAALADRHVQRHRAEQALANALGLPWGTLAKARLKWPGLDTPPAPSALPPAALAEDAAWNRLDLSVLLARYRASQARLRLAAGTRFPAMAVAPGYIYDRGTRNFSFGVDLELPLFHGAGARIQAAAAARDEAAAAVRDRQMHILNALDAARSDYAGRYAAWQQLKAAAATASDAARRARRLRAAGQISSNTALSAKVAASTARLAADDALGRTLGALGRLEDVLQRPIWPATRLTHMPTSPSSSAASANEATHAHRY